MIWPLLAIVSLMLADHADNEVGRFAFEVVALFLFSVGLFLAPWEQFA